MYLTKAEGGMGFKNLHVIILLCLQNNDGDWSLTLPHLLQDFIRLCIIREAHF